MTKKGISVLLYTALPAAVLLIGLFGKDRWYIVATSVLAVVYMLLLNDGIRAAYLLCALFGLSYGAVSFATQLYAGAVFHVFVLAPSGIYRFLKGGKGDESAVRSLTPKLWCAAISATAALAVALFFLLRAVGGSQPLLDALTIAISVATAVLLGGNVVVQPGVFSVVCGDVVGGIRAPRDRAGDDRFAEHRLGDQYQGDRLVEKTGAERVKVRKIAAGGKKSA